MREYNDNSIDNINDENMINQTSTIEKLTEVNRGPTVYKIEDAEQSPDIDNAKRILGQELINTVADYDLLGYEQDHLKTRYRGFFVHMTPQEIMTHQTSLLKKPLTNLPSSLNEMAVQLFKNLVSYMGDRKVPKSKINIF